MRKDYSFCMNGMSNKSSVGVGFKICYVTLSFDMLTNVLPRGSQRNVVYLGWPIAPSYMSPNAGGRGGRRFAGSQPMSTACEHGAQINLEYLTTYLSYSQWFKVKIHWPNTCDYLLFSQWFKVKTFGRTPVNICCSFLQKSSIWQIFPWTYSCFKLVHCSSALRLSTADNS